MEPEYKCECKGGKYDGQICKFDYVPDQIKLSKGQKRKFGKADLFIDGKKVGKVIEFEVNDEYESVYYEMYEQRSEFYYLYKPVE